MATYRALISFKRAVESGTLLLLASADLLTQRINTAQRARQQSILDADEAFASVRKPLSAVGMLPGDRCDRRIRQDGV